MNYYIKEYNSKLKSPSDAISLVPEKGTLSVGMAVSSPPALLKALENRILAGTIEELRTYYMHSEKAMHDSILKPEYMDRIKPHPFFMGKKERELVQLGLSQNRNFIDFIPANFSSVPNILKEIGVDIFLLTVAPMDKGGFFSCGTNSDYTIPTARNAKKLIVEVNPNMPRVFGDCCLHISEIDAIVEYDTPLVETPSRPTTDLDKKIGAIIAEMVPDRATMQFGIGGVPNAVCELLANHKDLGVHGELMGPGLAKLIRTGVVTNKYKNINTNKNIYTFALGDKELFEFLDNNSSMEAYPSSYVNDPYIISKNNNAISINSFIEIDLLGQVNSEAIHGREFTGSGGQLDFIRGSQLSKGGKSILANYSTASAGAASRIVPKISGPITDTRTEIQYVITEYGVVNLRGKSIAQRAMSLIEISHPKFKDELLKSAQELNYI